MNARVELIALVVRLVADRTNLIRKPDEFSAFLTAFITGETYDKTIAKNIDTEILRATNAVKKYRQERPKRTIFPFKGYRT